ncbi:SPOR domain-containing protein [Planctomycetota bacterium]
MDFREKDTAIILFCCILIVLLVIFFLSERRKFTLNNIDASAEGCHDIYNLSVHTYKLEQGSDSDHKKKLIAARNITIERKLLYLGIDRKGEMLVEVSSSFPEKNKTFRAQLVREVDLSVDFLPEGSCNFSFFDADLVKFRGQIVRKGEGWKYIRPLSLYGKRELNTEVLYTFKRKMKKGERNLAQIEFRVASKKWIDKGLNCVNKFAGCMWVDDETGKLEEAEYRFTKLDEHNSYLIEVELERLRSGMLTPAQLQNYRNKFDSPKKRQMAKDIPKKDMAPMHARGSRKELDQKYFPPVSGEMRTVQVRAISRNAEGKKAALELRKFLAEKGYASFIIADKKTYKVCVGKFTDRDNEKLQKRHSLMKQFFKDAFIRKVP